MALNPEEQDQVLTGAIDLLSQELLRVADIKGAALDQEIVQTTEITPGKTISSLDAAYQKLVGAGEQVIGRGPRGGKTIATWGGARAIDDPIRKETIFVAPMAEMTNAIVNAPHNDKAVVEQRYAATASPIAPFNVANELAALRGKQGEDLLEASSLLRANVNREIAKERDAIRTQAAIQSGLTEAEAAVRQNILLDQEKGGVFATQASAQTLQAQQLLDAATIRAQRYEASLVDRSTRLAELASANDTIKSTIDWKARQDIMSAERKGRQEDRFEQQRAMFAAQGSRELERFERGVAWQQEKLALEHIYRLDAQAQKQTDALIRSGITQNNADARQQAVFQNAATVRKQKIDLLNSTVTPEQLTNYRIVYGGSGNLEQDRFTIAMRRDRDKELAAVITADATSTFEMLASDNSGTREKALKLIDGYDKLLNAPDADVAIAGLAGSPEGGIAKMVREVVKKAQTPQSLLKELKDKNVYSTEQVKAVQSVLLAGGEKDKERNRKQLIQDAVNSGVASIMRDRFFGDVRNWVSSETTTGPLKQVIDSVRTKDGKVPLDVFIDTLISTQLTDATGQPIDDNVKLELFNRAADVSVANGAKSILFPATANLAIAEEIKAMTKGRMVWGKVLKWLDRQAIGAAEMNALPRLNNPVR